MSQLEPSPRLLVSRSIASRLGPTLLSSPNFGVSASKLRVPAVSSQASAGDHLFASSREYVPASESPSQAPPPSLQVIHTEHCLSRFTIPFRIKPFPPCLLDPGAAQCVCRSLILLFSTPTDGGSLSTRASEAFWSNASGHWLIWSPIKNFYFKSE